MRNAVKLFTDHWKLTVLFIGFATLYILLLLLTHPTQATLDKYGLTEMQWKRLNLAVAIPYVVIWGIALTGYLRLRTYVSHLDNTKDGVGFRAITTGVLLLVLWLPLNTLISNVSEYIYASNPESTASLVRLAVYANMMIILPAYYFMYKGVKSLLTIAKGNLDGLTRRQTMGFIAFASAFTMLTFSDTARNIAPDAAGAATYYMPDWLILSTVVIPRLVFWYLGFTAVAGLFLYRQKVRGQIYKQALGTLTWGIVGVLVATIFLRIVQSLNGVISDWSLTALVFLVYILLTIIAVGYIFIARGAKNLQKIEEL